MRFALLDDGGAGRLVVVEPDGSSIEVRSTLSAYAEVAGRESVVIPATPLDAALEGASFRALWEEALETLGASGLPLNRFPTDSRLLAPLPRPNRILAIGRNYSEHARELGNTVGEEPIVFLKASSCVVGPGTPIVLPEWVGRVDFEGELLAVIGKGGAGIAEADAPGHICAYSLFNDVTAREKQRALQEKKHPWFLAKSMDTFGPLGPYLVTAEEIPDPHNLRLTLRVNGEIRQDDTTGSMIFRLPFLVAYLSRWFALEPGDVIATGTPSGVGPLQAGDSVTIAATGLGELTNPVVSGVPDE